MTAHEKMESFLKGRNDHPYWEKRESATTGFFEVVA
jgi:hypothetical protein